MSDDLENDDVTLDSGIEDVAESQEQEAARGSDPRHEAMARASALRKEHLQSELSEKAELPGDENDEPGEVEIEAADDSVEIDDTTSEGSGTEAQDADDEEDYQQRAVSGQAQEPQEPQESEQQRAYRDVMREYRDLVAYGDMDDAETLAKAEALEAELDDHRYQQFRQRSQQEEVAAAFDQEAKRLMGEYPSLAPGGDAVLTEAVNGATRAFIAQGMPADAALRQAVKRFENVLGEPKSSKSNTPSIPDQSIREQRKRDQVVSMPRASARKTAPPPTRPQTRTDAIQAIKAARGQS